MDIIGGQHLRQMWDDLADVYGHKTALICESSGGVVNRYSYLELNQEINRTANLFYTLGIRKGDKVALHLDNCPEFIFCWFGLAKIGAIMVPINARLLREESAWILQNSRGVPAGDQCAILSYVSTDSARRCHSIAAHLPDRCGTSR